MCSIIPLSVFSMCACFYSHSLWYILSTFLVLGHEYKSSGLIQISGNELCVNVKVLWSQFKVLRRIGKRVKVPSVGTRGATKPGELETRQLCSFVISLSRAFSPILPSLPLPPSFHSSLSLLPPLFLSLIPLLPSLPPSPLFYPPPSSTLPPLPPSPPEAVQVYHRGRTPMATKANVNKLTTTTVAFADNPLLHFSCKFSYLFDSYSEY